MRAVCIERCMHGSEGGVAQSRPDSALLPYHFEVESAGNSQDEKALYQLIRLRALASQLDEAVFAVTSVTLESELDGRKVIFEAQGRRLISPGWQVVVNGDQADDSDEEAAPVNAIPKLREGSQAVAVSGKLLTKKTKPAARFTEASLIKELEKLGIGRPSTYSSTLDKLTATNQVKLEKRQLVPTLLGERIVSALNGHFGFVDYDFTRSLEKRLDDIAEGQTDYLTVVSATFGLLEKELKSFGHACPECGKPLRHLINQDDDPRKCYDYWACTNRPDCPASFVNDGGKPGARREKKPALLSEFKCPKCGKPLAYRRGTGKNNKPYEFFNCSGYPDCTEKFSPKDGQPDFESAGNKKQ